MAVMKQVTEKIWVTPTPISQIGHLHDFAIMNKLIFLS